MNVKLYFGQKSFRLMAFFAFVVAAQFQFGCNLSKFAPPGGNSATNSATAANTTGETVSENSANAAPELCRNAYYPVGANVERKYHIKYVKLSNLDQDYTEKYTDFNGDKFVAETDFRDVTTKINWRCMPDGLLATQYGNTIDMKNGAGAKIDTLESKGVSFPAESRWNAVEKWTTEYDIKETMNSAGGNQMNVEGSGTVTQNGEIIGAEEVTVPAGTFQTMKVKVKTTLDLKIKVSGMTVPTKTDVDTTAWFAKNVGMVKTETAIAGANMGTSELLSYTGTK